MQRLGRLTQRSISRKQFTKWSLSRSVNFKNTNFAFPDLDFSLPVHKRTSSSLVIKVLTKIPFSIFRPAVTSIVAIRFYARQFRIPHATPASAFFVASHRCTDFTTKRSITKKKHTHSNILKMLLPKKEKIKIKKNLIFFILLIKT